jgi:hypothetical protein
LATNLYMVKFIQGLYRVKVAMAIHGQVFYV